MKIYFSSFNSARRAVLKHRPNGFVTLVISGRFTGQWVISPDQISTTSISVQK